jgi:nucleotide-binding universal stress UspA family protein
MRILFAADQHPYSEYALQVLIKLAMNTWADVTLLGVQPVIKTTSRPGSTSISRALQYYRDSFLNSWDKETSPYEMQEGKYQWYPLKDGLWEEVKVFRGRKKEFKVRMRVGKPAIEIMGEAIEEGTDLIVLGCMKGESCAWEKFRSAPQEVASNSACSVLLVKEEQPVERILACLDQGYISQESLEMINQMITIHGARLELVGLSQNGDMNKSVYTRLIEIGDYYSDRDVEVSTRLTEVSDFERFMSREVGQDLLALWVGKKSLLSRFFSRDWVGRFVSKCQTSVLVMR